MKKIKLLLFAVIAFTSMQVHAQTIDEIVNKNVEAMGGKAKLTTLKTVKMTGGMNTQGIDITVVITKTQMTGMRLDLEFMGNSYYQFANATKGQMLMPGMTDPIDMDPDMIKSFNNQTDIQGNLLDYKEKGTTLVLVGTEKVNGADAYNLKATFKNGREANYFIDKTNGRLVKTSGKAKQQGQEMVVETTLSDYKQNADGYWFAYSVTNMQGTISFDKIETNIPVDEKVYSN